MGRSVFSPDGLRQVRGIILQTCSQRNAVVNRVLARCELFGTSFPVTFLERCTSQPHEIPLPVKTLCQFSSKADLQTRFLWSGKKGTAWQVQHQRTMGNRILFSIYQPVADASRLPGSQSTRHELSTSAGYRKALQSPFLFQNALTSHPSCRPQLSM